MGCGCGKKATPGTTAAKAAASSVEVRTVDGRTRTFANRRMAQSFVNRSSGAKIVEKASA